MLAFDRPISFQDNDTTQTVNVTPASFRNIFGLDVNLGLVKPKSNSCQHFMAHIISLDIDTS